MSHRTHLCWALAVLLFAAVVPGWEQAWAYRANKVWFEFHPGAWYRVCVNYTVPELKEFREAYVEFKKRRDAERFYWDLIRGAEFYPPKPELRRFEQQPLSPDPW